MIEELFGPGKTTTRDKVMGKKKKKGKKLPDSQALMIIMLGDKKHSKGDKHGKRTY